MGNRAVITTRERKIGLYMHWNGGRDTIEPLLRYCELKGYAPPSAAGDGWARLAQVIGNFFGGTYDVGIAPYTTDEQMDQGDNGIYVIEGWKIVERLEREFDENCKCIGVRPVEREQRAHDFNEMLHIFDENMPEDERLGDFLDAVEARASELKPGDEVWLRPATSGRFFLYEVTGFADDGIPMLARGSEESWAFSTSAGFRPRRSPETVWMKPREKA